MLVLNGSGLKISKSLYLFAEKDSSESTFTINPEAHDARRTTTIIITLRNTNLL